MILAFGVVKKFFLTKASVEFHKHKPIYQAFFYMEHFILKQTITSRPLPSLQTGYVARWTQAKKKKRVVNYLKCANSVFNYLR